MSSGRPPPPAQTSSASTACPACIPACSGRAGNYPTVAILFNYFGVGLSPALSDRRSPVTRSARRSLLATGDRRPATGSLLPAHRQLPAKVPHRRLAQHPLVLRQF